MSSNPLLPPSPPRNDSDLPELAAPNQPTTEAGTQPPLTLQPGARPVPDYELVRKLGKGGFGEVWQARGPGSIEVALKFIQLDKPESAARDLRSLDMMKSIRHPNLAGLFGVWRTDQLLILAMELCDRSLQDRLDEALQESLSGIPVRELLGYMHDAAEGLDALHDKQVQHRDVKPGNLLLLQKGVKVADFGLAKMIAETAGSHTGALTLAYAAPEFFKGETTKQSDQYSLAATYVHLRTGHMLFEGSYHQVVYGHISLPPDLSRLPTEEQIVVARALAKEPEKRWRTCKMFVNELIKVHTAEPSKPPQPPKKEVPPQAERAEKQTRSLAEPTILPPSPQSGRDNQLAELRKQETQDKTSRQRSPLRGRAWLWAACGAVVLLSCCFFGTDIGIGTYNSFFAVEKNEKVTQANLNKLTNNMGLTDVEKVLGPGKEATTDDLRTAANRGRFGSPGDKFVADYRTKASDRRIYRWRNEDDWIFIIFDKAPRTKDGTDVADALASIGLWINTNPNSSSYGSRSLPYPPPAGPSTDKPH